MQKNPRIELPKLRKSAEGKECMLEIAGVCNYDSRTTVLCHSNAGKHNKGVSMKAHDFNAIWACSSCHDWLDGRTHAEVPAEVKQFEFDLAHIRQLEQWFRDGTIKT